MTTAVRWSGLSGALRLARGRADGLLLFPADLISAARSFWAAALCVPLYALMLVLSWHQVGWPADLPHEAVLQAVLFVLGWAAYAVISFEMLSALGIAGRWPRFIIVWNWVNVVQYGLLLVSAAPGAAGAPDWVGETCTLVAQGWTLWLEWYAIRLALGCSRVMAALIMAPDVVLGLFLAGVGGG